MDAIIFQFEKNENKYGIEEGMVDYYLIFV